MKIAEASIGLNELKIIPDEPDFREVKFSTLFDEQVMGKLPWLRPSLQIGTTMSDEDSSIAYYVAYVDINEAAGSRDGEVSLLLLSNDGSQEETKLAFEYPASVFIGSAGLPSDPRKLILHIFLHDKAE